MKKSHQQRFNAAIAGVMGEVEEEAFKRGLDEGMRRAAQLQSAAIDGKDAVIVNLRAHRVKLREAMILIRQHVAPSGTDRGDSAVDSIAWAALQASAVDEGAGVSENVR